jgi:AcrR family transcriptional regulator
MDRAQRRTQILARAREVFAKRGYHAAKIDEIVEVAGVARGTFYLYFPDKRAVFAELVDRFLTRLHLSILRIDVGAPIEPQVRENIRRVLELFLADRAMAKILLADAPGLDAEFDRKLHSVYDEVLTLLAESLAEGQGLGIVAAGDPRVYAYLSTGALKELLYQSVQQGMDERDAPRLGEQVFAFLSRGYLQLGDAKGGGAKKKR